MNGDEGRNPFRRECWARSCRYARVLCSARIRAHWGALRETALTGKNITNNGNWTAQRDIGGVGLPASEPDRFTTRYVVPVDYQAVGLDLDGTLCDHRGAAGAAADGFVTWLGAPKSRQNRVLWLEAEEEQFEQWRAGRTTFQEQRRRRLRSFLPAIQICVPSEDAQLDALFEQYLLRYRAAWRPFPDAVELLADLHRQQIPVGVLSNGNQAQQFDKLVSTGLDRYIGVVCTSELIGFAKPDPRAFQALANQLGVAHADLVFLGDNPDHDVAGARAVGIRAGLVERDGLHEVNLFEALANAR